MIVHKFGVDLGSDGVLSPLAIIVVEIVLPSIEGDLRLEQGSLVDWNARDVDECGVDDGSECKHEQDGFHVLEIEIISPNGK